MHFDAIQSQSQKNGTIYQCWRLGEYLMYPKDFNNSDHAIVRWMNNYVIFYINIIEFDLDNTTILDYMNNLEQEQEIKQENADESSYQTINLGMHANPQNIRIFKGIKDLEETLCTEFFIHNKSAFVWTYGDLKDIPAELFEHCIILKDDAQHICQRPDQFNSKYSLMKKEELEKLLEVDFINLVL